MLALTIITTILLAITIIIKLMTILNDNYIDISILFDIFTIITVWVLYGGTC